MKFRNSISHPGVAAALCAAFLFGAGTPLVKLLLASVTLVTGRLVVCGVGLGMLGAKWPSLAYLSVAMLVGFLADGVSLRMSVT